MYQNIVRNDLTSHDSYGHWCLPITNYTYFTERYCGGTHPAWPVPKPFDVVHGLGTATAIGRGWKTHQQPPWHFCRPGMISTTISTILLVFVRGSKMVFFMTLRRTTWCSNYSLIPYPHMAGVNNAL